MNSKERGGKNFFLNRFEFLGDSSNRSTLRLDGKLEFDRMIG